MCKSFLFYYFTGLCSQLIPRQLAGDGFFLPAPVQHGSSRVRVLSQRRHVSEHAARRRGLYTSRSTQTRPAGTESESSQNLAHTHTKPVLFTPNDSQTNSVWFANIQHHSQNNPFCFANKKCTYQTSKSCFRNKYSMFYTYKETNFFKYNKISFKYKNNSTSTKKLLCDFWHNLTTDM